MARTVGIGIQSFEKIREKNYFYIDKTAFIKEWWESGDDVTLITRPRRFGKTLNMSMMEQFFSTEYAGRNDLFEGLDIWKEEKYHKLQGTYPVISFSFANVKATNYETAKKQINQLLSELYEKKRFLLEGELLSKSEKEYYCSVRTDMDEATATAAIHKMSDYLCRYYGKKVIILLDEYDTPMQESYVYEYGKELVEFIRSLFNFTFKTNPYLSRAIMTGITRISKESIFSDLNHLKVVTTTSNEYATSFGFTENEVFAALEEFGLDREKGKVKQWYDGFVFGDVSDIYNPWSILNYLDTKRIDTYWVNTSGNNLVSKLIREGNRSIKYAFEQLLQGEVIYCVIDEQIVYNQLNGSEAAIWSLLVASGYLKVLSKERYEDIPQNREPLYELAVTNQEVGRMFHRMVDGWFAEVEADYNDFIKALLLGDLDAMNEYMNRVALQTFSYFDTGTQAHGAEPERFYHGFVLGLMVELSGRYIITSNRESGFGRYDVMLEPEYPEQDDAIILEFKVKNKRREETLEETLAAALKQIEEKQYAAQLVAKGIRPEKIRSYGFAFEGKNVLIG